MADIRVEKFARLLVDYCTKIGPGDRVAVEATTAAEPLIRALYARILERGGHPHLLLDLPDQDVIFYEHAGDDQLDFAPTFRKLAYDTFESRIRIGSSVNPRALGGVDPKKQARRQKALSPILEAQMRRGADGQFRWVTTLFPTEGYAMESEMSLRQYENFVYRACHVDEKTADPVAFWQGIEKNQRKVVDWLNGRPHLRQRERHAQHARRRDLHRPGRRVGQRLGEVYLSRHIQRRGGGGDRADVR
jgi:aminopeptidase